MQAIRSATVMVGQTAAAIVVGGDGRREGLLCFLLPSDRIAAEFDLLRAPS